MNRLLLPSNSFTAAAKKLVKQQRESSLGIQSALELLAIDAFHPRLKTYKLKGELQGLWESIGTHDEVY